MKRVPGKRRLPLHLRLPHLRIRAQAIVFIDRQLIPNKREYILHTRATAACPGAGTPIRSKKDKGEEMKYIAQTLTAVTLCCSTVAGIANAASIQSMTIEEIGAASGGLGTSGLAGGGGWGNWYTADQMTMAPPAYFVSDGTDDALIMGTTQANGAISTGFTWGETNHFEINTLNGAPSGTITDGFMSLNLSGMIAEFTLGNTAFPFPPDSGTLQTSVSMIDANHYFYTADWTHVFNNDVYYLDTLATQPGWNGSSVALHFEGVATLTPVPEAETYTMLLAGLGLVGLMANRRRTRV